LTEFHPSAQDSCSHPRSPNARDWGHPGGDRFLPGAGATRHAHPGWNGHRDRGRPPNKNHSTIGFIASLQDAGARVGAFHGWRCAYPWLFSLSPSGRKRSRRTAAWFGVVGLWITVIAAVDFAEGILVSLLGGLAGPVSILRVVVLREEKKPSNGGVVWRGWPMDHGNRGG